MWIIFFFKTDNPECQKIKEEYKTLSNKLYGIVRVAAIDCDEDEEMCEEFTIYDVPKIIAFTENYRDDGEKYTDKYDWKKMSSFVTKKMQDFVSVVTLNNYNDFFEREKEI